MIGIADGARLPKTERSGALAETGLGKGAQERDRVVPGAEGERIGSAD
jgi:hypothetical protein